MAIERLVPSNVYEQFSRGQPLKNYISQVIKASGSNHVYTSGTVSVNEDGEIVGEDDMEAQCRQVMENIEKSVEAAGGSISDVVSITTFAVDVDRYYDSGGRAVVNEFFPADAKPTSTTVGIDRLAEERFLVEIKAVAVLD